MILSRATLLNGQELTLSPTSELPVLSPKVKKPSKSSSVMIPGDSIFFVIMPESKVRTCSVAPLTAPDLNLSELTKRLRLGSQKKSGELKEEKEEEEDTISEEGVYVSFTKKRSAKPSKDESPPKSDILGKTVMRTLMSKLAPRKIDIKTEADQEDIPVKYITFNENSFLNKLAEGVKEEIEGTSTESTDGKANQKSKVEYKYPALASAIKASKTDRLSETSTMPSPKSYTTSSTTNENAKIQVISINPLEPAGIDDGKPLSRSRRSSKEELVVDTSHNDTEPTEIIKSLMEARKNGAPLSGEMSEIDKNLNQHDVIWKLPIDDTEKEEKTRNARKASLEQDHEATILKVDSEDKPRNVRHAGDASEEQESIRKTEDATAESTKGKDIETEALAKILEKTEHISSVKESPQSILIPADATQEKLEDMMLETAKSNSDPEPDGSPSKDDASKDSPLTNTELPGTQLPAEQTESVPMLLLPAQQHMSLIGQAGGQNSPLPGQFNPMLVPTQPNPGTMMAQENSDPMVMPSVGGSDPLSPSSTNVPLSISPTSPVLPGAPYYNEKKENAINKILKEIVRKDNPALAKIPTDGLKPGVLAEIKPREVVPIDVEGETMLIAPGDLTALKQPDAEGVTVSGPAVTEKPEGGEVDAGSGSQTLADSGQHLDLASEAGNQGTPSVKVARQVRIQVPITVSPKPTTATLAAPIESLAPTTPGPVSPFSTKETKLSPANQLPPLKAPSPEELRERYKVLREKMLELRQQYFDARDKKLEEFRKQVAMARTTPDAEDVVKSTIKRREAELKEWFKKFDKREINPAQLSIKPDLLAKPRPRRLTMFTTDENLDMEEFFKDDAVESFNYKRSPEIASPQQQIPLQSEVPSPKKVEHFGKLLIPLDSKSPQGIVYNNRIYPARLFGYINPLSSGHVKEIDGPKEMSHYGEYTMRETTEVPHFARERLSYVPKDAFIREFKSDFVPVVLLDPEESSQKTTRSRRSTLTRSKSSSPVLSKLARSKRSTLTDLEDQIHRIKDEMFPKISSWIKNFSEHPPWKRDLERSSRVRRSIPELLLTNDLRSLKYRPRAPSPFKDTLSNTQEIEDFILQNIDKGENDIFKVAKKYSGLTDITLPRSEPNMDETTKNGYCEEIGTSGKSVIRDPFEENSKTITDSIEISKAKSTSTDQKSKGDVKTESSKSSENDQGWMKAQASQSNDQPTDQIDESVEETMFATIVADKIREFFSNVQKFMGVSDR